MNMAPEIGKSTEEERLEYVKNRFSCIADCDACGLCSVFHGKDPEITYADYIRGDRGFEEVARDYK